ncbi:MAG: hypothetical protein EHM28_01250 [Spirochaetaceae bacterium]|nr:MAG: hypothetical protein EHM28_01250 [Spirochaetaceae bacterium]
MPTREEISEILASFMNNASPAEVKELQALLKKRRGPGGVGKLNLTGMAKQVAASIKEQMGLSEKFVKETATSTVTRLIKAYAPDISDKDLEALLGEMIPSLKRKKAPKIPPDMLKTMIAQFIDYSLGRMSDADKAEMPAQWSAKYWNAFPPIIRNLITKLLHNEIDEELFWLAVTEAIRRMENPKT